MSETRSIMQNEFHVSKAGDSSGETLGPWSLAELTEKLASAEISVTDFVFDDQLQDWIPILDCVALKESLRQQKPKAPPPKRAKEPVAETGEKQAVPSVEENKPQTEAYVQASAGAAAQPSPSNTGGEWFVLKGTHRYGPFTYLGLVRALQEKTVYEFDFVWTEGMENWVRLAESEYFQAEKIRELSVSSATENSGAFLRRAHPRVKLDNDVIVHDDRSAWVGKSYEGSPGGSGLLIENAALHPGQVIRVHFSSSDGLPAFNALAEIVNKKFVKEVKSVNSPVQYAVRFLEIESASVDRLQDYCRRQAA